MVAILCAYVSFACYTLVFLPYDYTHKRLGISSIKKFLKEILDMKHNNQPRRTVGAAVGTLFKFREKGKIIFKDNPKFPTSEVEFSVINNKYLISIYTYKDVGTNKHYIKSLVNSVALSKKEFLEIENIYDSQSYVTKDYKQPMSIEERMESDDTSFDIKDDNQPSPEQILVHKETLSECKQFKETLSEKDKLLFESFIERNLSEAEYAVLAQCSTSTANYRKKHDLERIRARFRSKYL